MTYSESLSKHHHNKPELHARQIESMELNVEFQPLVLSMANELWELFKSIKTNSEMTKYLLWIEKDMKSVDDVKKFITDAIKKRIKSKKFSFAIMFNGEIAGIITHSPSGENPEETSIGYFLGPDFTGKGIAKAALLKLSKELVAEQKKPVVHIQPSNYPSFHLARACGYINSGRQLYNTMRTYIFDGNK